MKFEKQKTIEEHFADLAAKDVQADEYQAADEAAQQKRLADTGTGMIAAGLRALPADPQKVEAVEMLSAVEKLFAARNASRGR